MLRIAIKKVNDFFVYHLFSKLGIKSVDVSFYH